MPSYARNDFEWWRNKLSTVGERVFGPAVSRHAVALLDILANAPDHRIEATDLQAFGRLTRTPITYLPRATAVLTRSGIAAAVLGRPVSMRLLTARLKRRKNSAQAQRGRLSKSERQRVIIENRRRCAHCLETFSPTDLQVDHIIPISVFGADEPANWVVLCKPHNRRKWDAFDRTFIRLYRGHGVTRPVGLRFRAGYFWPVVNGILRLDSRGDWAAERLGRR